MSPTGNTADFLLSEADGQRSRALFNLPTGQGYLRAGTILDTSGNAATTNADVGGVLYGSVDTGETADASTVKATVIDNDAEVHGEMLQWAESDTDAIKAGFANALKTLGIRTRWTERPAGLETDQPEPDAGDDQSGGGG